MDLFEPTSARSIIQDRSLAAHAVRFYQALSWMFPMPHYSRVHGAAVVIPDIADCDGLELVRKIARRLGGPTEGEPLREWVSENFERVDDAIEATGLAMRRRMFEGVDAKFSRAIYRLRGTPEELLRRPDELSGIEREPATEDELQEEFTQCREWFDEPAPLEQNQPALPPAFPRDAIAGRSSLGRVLVGPDKVRIETSSAARYQSLRRQFERLAGWLVELVGERVDDLGARLLRDAEPLNEALVPPSLLERAPRIVLQTSKLMDLPPNLPQEGVNRCMQRRHLELFLDDSLPALGGLTPRQAAADPAWRPKLVQLRKSHVRRHDEENLRAGRTDNINWLLRELGLTEILFDPPPPRPVPPAMEDEDVEDGSEPPASLPPLPVHPMNDEEVAQRIGHCIQTFRDPDKMMGRFEAEAPEICDALSLATERNLNDDEWSLLLMLAAEAWFVLFPDMPPAQRPSTANFLRAIQEEFAAAGSAFETPFPDGYLRYLESGRQPALTKALAATTLDASPLGGEHPRSDLKPSS